MHRQTIKLISSGGFTGAQVWARLKTLLTDTGWDLLPPETVASNGYWDQDPLVSFDVTVSRGLGQTEVPRFRVELSGDDVGFRAIGPAVPSGPPWESQTDVRGSAGELTGAEAVIMGTNRTLGLLWLAATAPGQSPRLLALAGCFARQPGDADDSAGARYGVLSSWPALQAPWGLRDDESAGMMAEIVLLSALADPQVSTGFSRRLGGAPLVAPVQGRMGRGGFVVQPLGVLEGVYLCDNSFDVLAEVEPLSGIWALPACHGVVEPRLGFALAGGPAVVEESV